jgi:hypothetical protein
MLKRNSDFLNFSKTNEDSEFDRVEYDCGFTCYAVAWSNLDKDHHVAIVSVFFLSTTFSLKHPTTSGIIRGRRKKCNSGAKSGGGGG